MSAYPYGTLKFPDGTLDEQLLECLLQDAHDQQIKDTTQLAVLIHRRVARFVPSHPRYETVERKLSLATLRQWYKRETGRNFTPNNDRYLLPDAVWMIMFDPKTGASFMVDIGS